MSRIRGIGVKILGVRWSGDQRRRFVKASLLAALVGGVIICLVQYLVLPALARRLTTSQVIWLRETFQAHPGWVLFTILGVTALLGLPVLLVALWAMRIGPWREEITRVSDD